MKRLESFAAGSPIVWRSRPNGAVGYVFGCRVLIDTIDVKAVLQPAHAPVVRRVGRRGGPNGRTLLPGTWDGTRRMTRWDRPPVVRLHPVGRAYSVIRTWCEGDHCFDGWYVNLESPWVRSTVGFDSRDDVLDVTVSDDLSDASLKDEDELAFACEVGMVTSGEARSIRLTADSAIEDVISRHWPFFETAWSQFSPPNYDAMNGLPPGWDNP